MGQAFQQYQYATPETNWAEQISAWNSAPPILVRAGLAGLKPGPDTDSRV